MSARQFQLYADGASWERIGFGIDTRNVSILVGCMLALLLALPGRPRLEKAAVARAASPPRAWIAFFFVDFGRQLFAGPLVVFAICCAMLILGVLDGRSPLARALSLGPVVFVGRISYSLYLWHFPVFVILDVNKPGVVPAAVPALAHHGRTRAGLLLPHRASVPATQAACLARSSFTLSGSSRVRCAEPGGLTGAQKTGVSRHTPHTSRSASHISPSVT